MRYLIATFRDAQGAVVTMAGRLSADAVAELRRVIGELSGPLRLDLAGLRAVDEAGVTALRTLREQGVALTGLSRFNRLLLGRPPRAPDETASRKPRRPTPSADGARRRTRGGRRGRP